MAKINAGVVLVTKFVSADNAVFSGYIDYINRSNAVRNENIEKYTIPTLDNEIKEYNEYMDYMGDAKKTTELFTDKKDRLSAKEKDKLKDIFQIAQNNGSLMWQSVISFDNKWLAENGLYDPESGVLSEIKIKEYARIAINSMLEKEGMAQNSIWSASIHYNTDNIHIHIATVQPVPSRETKIIRTIRFNNKWLSEKIDSQLLNALDIGENIKAHKTPNKNYAKVLQAIKDEIFIETGRQCKLGDYMQLNNDGTLDISYYGQDNDIPHMAQLQSKKQVQKGVFKESSIETAKSRMVNKILGQNLINDRINGLMRDTLINDFKNLSIDNHNLKRLYFDLHESLPANKRLWQYNNNVMSPLRSKIDRFTDEWLKQYHWKDYEQLQASLKHQQQMYQTAYGGTENNFADNKIKDLYSRCGNIILKNLKELDKSGIIDFNEIFSTDDEEISDVSVLIDDPEPVDDIMPDISFDPIEETQDIENSISDEEVDEYLSSFEESTYLEFSEKYKKAKQHLYGTKKMAPDHQTAFNLLEDEAQSGNAYAMQDLANCYAKGLGCTANTSIAFQLYKRALKAYESEIENFRKDNDSNKKSDLSYLNYRIGKMYYYGQGTEVNKKIAFDKFTASQSNTYSLFYLAKFYENGEPNVVDKDLSKAFDLYSTVCESKEKMPYAYFKKAYMLEKGLGTNVNKKLSQQSYKAALSGFLHSIEQRPDNFLQYRIGQMYLNGKGCKADLEKAVKYLELAYKGGNDMAACSLANIYVQNKDDPKKIDKAFKLLHHSADKNNNVQAQYNLAKLYMERGDIKKSLKYFFSAAEKGNQFAQYKLGVYFLENNEKEAGVKHLTDAAKQGNQYAQNRLGAYYLENKEIEKGIKYLTDAANQNNSSAMYRLGVYYLNSGETQKGIEFLLSAEKQENLFAKNKLGLYFLKNDNVPKGIEYLNSVIETKSEDKLIKQLKSSAQYNLGSYYFNINDFEKGIELLSSAAQDGNIFAANRLGIYFLKNNMFDKAFPYLENVINAETEDIYTQRVKISAQYNLGCYYLNNGETEKGIELLRASAKQNNCYALYRLGSYYLSNGNDEEGIKYLNSTINFESNTDDENKNIEKVKSMAEYKLGNYYFETNEAEKGIKLLTAAADKNNPFAQYKLGVYFLNNDEAEKGISYLQDAAAQDNDSAKFKLGSYYIKNDEIQKGVEYLIDLSDKDNVFANIKLGNLYSQADYFDFKKAEKYYLKAAGKGINTAEYNLGILYLSDKNNISHCLKGIDYLNIAANQGNENAMYQLGKIYFYGNKYISPDRDLANQYLKGAADKGHKGAKYLLKRPKRHRISLPKFHIPYEIAYNLQRLMSELARDYRTHENIMNQIAYAKLQKKIEEQRG